MSEENLEKNENDEAGFGFHIIVFLLTLPLGMIIGRWMPEMILPIGDGFSLHGIISMICAYFLLSNLLYPLRGIINLIGIVGLSIVLFMFWNGNLKKDEIKSLFYTSVGAITQHKIAGRSIDHEPEIIKAIEDDNELDGFVKSYGNTSTRTYWMRASSGLFQYLIRSPTRTGSTLMTPRIANYFAQ